MRFRISTLMVMFASLGMPLALTAPLGQIPQLLAMLCVLLVWAGGLITLWASDWSPDQAGVVRHIMALTAGLFSTLLGVVGVCYCVGIGLSRWFT
ncbi:MAG: hypothetical protein KDB14_12790 [Planctomycetales bacterium]|nr:hypothetical protein [Planctomycetales bacterium]